LLDITGNYQVLGAMDAINGQDMHTIHEIYAKEVAPEVHTIFKKDGALKKKPQEMTEDDMKVARSEFDKLLAGQESAFYAALQPIYKWREGQWRCVQKEILLRAKDGQQNAPGAVFFVWTAQDRMRFLLWQCSLAKQIAKEEGIFVSLNCYAQDLEEQAVRDLIVETCGQCNVIIEITEYSKDGDAPGFPANNKAFTAHQVQCMRDLAERGIRISVDDYNPTASNYACDQDFVRKVKDFVFQVKFDLKLCSQIFENIPIINGSPAPKFFPPAETPEELEHKRNVTKESVEELENIDLVGEGSVLKEETGKLFPSLDPFTTNASIQGGNTHNWAQIAPQMHATAFEAYIAAKDKLRL
jgi:EAL domain-containing protein (putative c-di-GMP-specific phosphodiesterase class I)